MTQYGDISLSEDEDGGDGPSDGDLRGDGQVEEQGLAYNCEADKCAADEDFVGERVEHSSELACDAEFSGDGAIGDIGKARDDEDDECDVEEEGAVVHVGRIQDHQEEDDGEDEPAEGQDVRNLF